MEILGQSSDPQSIQGHLLSLFDAVYRVFSFAVGNLFPILLLVTFQVDFDEQNPDQIVAMNSDLGEKIVFEKSVACAGGVEIWLNTLLSMVRDTVRNIIAAQCQALADPEYDFITGFVQSCGQVRSFSSSRTALALFCFVRAQAGLVGIQVLWTRDAEIAIKKSRIDRTIMKMTNQKFLDLLNALIDLTSKDLNKMQRIRFETMVTIHVHQRSVSSGIKFRSLRIIVLFSSDIFDDIVKLKVRTPVDFEWQKQARFYYNDENDEIVVKITDVIFVYQNEYLGITERLAITPLTDRCYITLAQAICKYRKQFLEI